MKISDAPCIICNGVTIGVFIRLFFLAVFLGDQDPAWPGMSFLPPGLKRSIRVPQDIRYIPSNVLFLIRRKDIYIYINFFFFSLAVLYLSPLLL